MRVSGACLADDCVVGVGTVTVGPRQCLGAGVGQTSCCCGLMCCCLWRGGQENKLDQTELSLSGLLGDDTTI